jgi:hypothetical protein
VRSFRSGTSDVDVRISFVVGVIGILFVIGCHRKLPALLDAGRIDEVIERAESSRFAPRGKAARAHAEALVRRGNVERARSVLLVDFRKGGDVASLVALADLERGEGLDGIALLHYERAADLDRALLVGREDVCALFGRRARDLLRLGEALAAEEDLARVRQLCARGSVAARRDDALARAIDVAARAQVRDRAQRTRCPPAGCEAAPDPDPAATVVAALERARAQGARALRAEAARLRAQLEPSDIVTLLLAEARGDLDFDLLPDHEVRRWVGGQRWADLASTIGSRDAVEVAWLQLRLSAVLDDVPMPTVGAGPTMRDRWADRALELRGAQRWRIEAYAGDLGGAELALAAAFRPAVDEAGEAADVLVDEAPADEGVPAPSHWAARVVPTTRSVEAMLLLARLREAAGQDDKGLEIARHTLARGARAGIEAVPGLAVRNAVRQLARGRPWHALAIADAVPTVAIGPTMAAAASAILLEQVFCDGVCPGDTDRAAVERVLGEDWLAAMSSRLPRLAGRRASTTDSDARCPTLQERLAPDAVGPVAEALRRARRSLGGAGLGDALSRALASDPTLACAGRHVLPLMEAAGTSLSAAALADHLAHAPRMRAEPMLRTHAELALVGGQHARAELLCRAAAGASTDPAATWAAIARRAHGVEAREIELMALRETILHTSDLDHESARHALVVLGLRDLARGTMVRDREVGREAAARHVADHLDRYAEAQRWAQREVLARVVGRAAWADAVRPLLEEALLPTDDLKASHPIGLAWLRGGAPRDVQTFDGAGLELAWARGQAGPLPRAVDVFADPVAFEDARLQVAARARDWSSRRAAAIGLAVYGTPRARATAVVALAAMLGEDQTRRAALHDWLLSRPAALEPETHEPTWSLPRATVVVADEEALLRVIYDLDPTAWFPQG